MGTVEVVTSASPSHAAEQVTSAPWMTWFDDLPSVVKVRVFTCFCPLVSWSSEMTSDGSLRVILRMNEAGIGAGPKMLLSAFIFHSPEKSGLSAARALPAPTSRVSNHRNACLIGSNSPRRLLLVKNDQQYHVALRRTHLELAGEGLAISRKRHVIVVDNLVFVSLGGNDQSVAIPHR